MLDLIAGAETWTDLASPRGSSAAAASGGGEAVATIHETVVRDFQRAARQWGLDLAAPPVEILRVTSAANLDLLRIFIWRPAASLSTREGPCSASTGISARKGDRSSCATGRRSWMPPDCLFASRLRQVPGHSTAAIQPCCTSGVGPGNDLRGARNAPTDAPDATCDPPTPVFTKRIAPGIAVAEEPRTGDSFGQSRCEIRGRLDPIRGTKHRRAISLRQFDVLDAGRPPPPRVSESRLSRHLPDSVRGLIPRHQRLPPFRAAYRGIPTRSISMMKAGCFLSPANDGSERR